MNMEMQNRSERLYTRVTPEEKNRIHMKALKCGLSESEYIRKRALGYEPRAIPPPIMYDFMNKLESLYVKVDGKVSGEIEKGLNDFMEACYAEFFRPGIG